MCIRVRFFFFFQAEDGIRDRSPSRGLGDVYKRQEHVDLFDEFEADLSLRESAKGTQQYNVTHAPCQLWLSRAAEIEVQSVVEHLTQGKTSPLSLCLTEAIEVAEAAKQSMVTEKQISVKK